MKTIISKLNELGNQLAEILKTKSHVLATDEEYENHEDFIVELPRVSKVDKYSFYVPYVILELKKGGILRCGSTGDEHGKIIEIDLSELNTDDLKDLASNI